MASLQEQINKTNKNGILSLRFGEFKEDLVIKKPITLRSDDMPITIVGKSPTLSIESKDVILENLNILSNDELSLCIKVKKGSNPKFKDVYVNGIIEGLEDEEGNWEIPNVLELSVIPDKTTHNILHINCPVPSKIYTIETEDIQCDLQKLKPGINEIKLIIDKIPKNRLITGSLIIETSKYKIKRKIALNGNTIKEPDESDLYDGKVIWICESATDMISMGSLKQLPEANQNVPYEYILDEEEIKCTDYNITINDLPEGLIFNESSTPRKIEGIPKQFGSYKIKIIFEKNGKEFGCISQLKIEESKVIPLKIKPIKDPIKSKEDESLKFALEILSRNSSDIKFIVVKKLPDGLNLNENTGEIVGKISKHGQYDSVVKIEDDANEITQTLNFLVVPKNPLVIKVNKTYQVLVNDELKIPINVDDAQTLSLKIKYILKPNDINLNTTKTTHGFEIQGKFKNENNYSLELEIEDSYKRLSKENLIIKCIEKPTYTIKWLTDKFPIIVGKKDDPKGEWEGRIQAEILEDPKVKLIFESIGHFPSNMQLKDNGWLKVTVKEDATYSIKIKAVGKEVVSEKEFTLITKIDKEHIIKGSELKKGIWDTDKNDKKLEEKKVVEQSKQTKLGKAFE